MSGGRDVRPGVSLGAAIDVESVPEAGAMAIAGRAASGGVGRFALHRLVCASALRFERCEATGAFSRLALVTATVRREPESALLGTMDVCLPDPSLPSSTLVSWNGQHDLRLLRHRAVALWMTGLPNVRGWTEGAAGRHRDHMLDGQGRARQWWRLADVCAGLGFRLHEGGATVATMLAAGRWEGIARRNRMDVLGTFLVHAARDAFALGCPVPAATAWIAVAGLLRADDDPWMRELADHHLVGVARRRLDDHARGQEACGCAARAAA